MYATGEMPPSTTAQPTGFTNAHLKRIQSASAAHATRVRRALWHFAPHGLDSMVPNGVAVWWPLQEGIIESASVSH